MARTISYKEAINEALDQEMTRDKLVIVMGEDSIGGTGSPGEDDAWGGPMGVTKGLYGKHGTKSWTPLYRNLHILVRQSVRLPVE